MKFKNFVRSQKIIFTLCFVVILTIFILNLFGLFSSKKTGPVLKYQAFIVAQSPLKQGDILTMENTTVVFLDLALASDQFVRNAEFSKFENLTLRENVNTNLPILKKSLLPSEFAEDNIPTGKRLFVLDMPVGPLVSILKPNDLVDVIAQIDMPNLGNVTETILESVRIVAIGNDSSARASADNENSFLSFYLTPDEVKIISFMKPYSQFSVVLRNPLDIERTKNYAVTFNRFIQNEKIQKIIESDSFRIINGRKLK